MQESAIANNFSN